MLVECRPHICGAFLAGLRWLCAPSCQADRTATLPCPCPRLCHCSWQNVAELAIFRRANTACQEAARDTAEVRGRAGRAVRPPL